MTNQKGLSEAKLIHSIVGGNPKLQGTWVQQQLAINLAQWLSSKFAVKISQWVYEWSQRQVKFATPRTFNDTLAIDIKSYILIF